MVINIVKKFIKKTKVWDNLLNIPNYIKYHFNIDNNSIVSWYVSGDKVILEFDMKNDIKKSKKNLHTNVFCFIFVMIL